MKIYNSSIFKNILLLILGVSLLFVGVTYYTYITKVDKKIEELDKQNAKEVLKRVVTVVKDTYYSLENFKNFSKEIHKNELKNITDVATSILNFEKSSEERLKKSLKNRANELKEIIYDIYNSSKNSFEAKKEIIDFIKNYRYNGKRGYFWINDLSPNMIIHPINSELNGKYLGDYKDKAGIKLFKNIVEICKKNKEGFLKYKWINPNSQKIEDKLGYVFLFEPLNWIIGTGEYLEEFKNESKQNALEILQNLRYGDNNYIFAIDYDGNALVHPKLRGKNIIDLKDVKGSYIIKTIIDLAKKNKEGYYSYWWYKNKDDKKIYEKLSYFRDISELGIILGTGLYLDKLEKEEENIKNELIKKIRKIIKETKIAKSGYVFIFDEKGFMIAHPNSNIDKTDFKGVKNPTTGNGIFYDLVKAAHTPSKVLRYKWDKPEDKGNYIYEKISWVEYIPELKWYVASSVYLDDIKATSNEIYKNLIFSLIFIVLLSMLLTYFYLRKILAPMVDLTNLAKKVKHGNYNLRCIHAKSKGDIALLSSAFNEMLDTIEDNITNLDNRVKEKTRKLEEQKESFEQLFFNVYDASIILDLEGNILECNSSALEMFGYKKPDFLKLTPIDLSPETQPDGSSSMVKAKEKIESALKNGSCRFEWLHIKKDGSEFWTQVTLSKIKFNEKDALHALIRDISKEKELEKTLKDAKDKAEEMAKAKSSFLANMSHEIRTPMNGIVGLTDLVLKTELNTKQKDYMLKIKNSASILLGIINDILDFSKIEAGKLSIEKIEFDLYDMLNHISNMVGVKAYEKGLDFVISYHKDVPRKFRGDPLRLTQIITNLLGNAIKFTQKGQVGVYISKICKNRYRFEVKDTGIGISKEAQAKLFNAFTQADGSTTRKFGGTGLGLAISKQLVELMNGKIWVESIEGIGSNFIFEIELEELDGAIEGKFSKRVLVVDDTPTWLEVLKHLLISFDVKVTTALSGEEAIDILQKDKFGFDAILIDWMMPGLDGIETVKKINELIENTPKVIMVSAYKQDEIVQKAKDEAKIEYFLQKPFDPKVLKELLEKIFLGKTSQTDEEHLENIDFSIFEKCSVLIAEDNVINQDVIRGIFEDSDIEVDIANNGEEAVFKFKSAPSKYSLILMDIQMPVMDGYEATKEIREIDKEIPILALSANAMKEDVEKSLENGMNGHITKPIVVKELFNELKKYLKTKGSDIGKKNRETDDDLPQFENLDVKSALNALAGNKKIYKNILKGLLEYKNLKLEEKDADEFKRVTHTIKGLSASAGAKELHKIAKELDETQNRDILPKFYEELKKVLDEIEEKLSFEIEKKEKITKEKRDELFEKLKEAVKTKRANKVKPVIEEMQKYEFDQEDKELMDEIVKLSRRYKFKEILNLISD